MTYDPERHHRRSTRMKGHDYALPGAYYVTICVYHRLCLFGEIIDGDMRSNEAGRTIERWWRALPSKYPRVSLDAFVVMPNHVHGVVLIGAEPDVIGPGCRRGEGGHTGPPLRRDVRGQVGMDRTVFPLSSDDAPSRGQPTLGTVLQWFKTMTTNDYIACVNHMDWPPFDGLLWQRGYHDRIVRNDRELDHIRNYIANNPATWHQDDENPAAPPPSPS